MYKPKTKEELKLLVNNPSISLGEIDTSLITDMSCVFYKSKGNDFSGLENWDVSNVLSTGWMFEGSTFNGDISEWDVSSVENMQCMFAKSKFNDDISKWNLKNLSIVCFMFKESAFNGILPSLKSKNLKFKHSIFYKSKLNKPSIILTALQSFFVRFF